MTLSFLPSLKTCIAALMLLPHTALAAGFSLQAEGISSYGPDAYATVRLQAEAQPGVEVGVLAIGGTQPAWLATGARTLRLADGFTARGEVDLGLLRRTTSNWTREAPTVGLRLGARGAITPEVAAVVDFGAIGGVGLRGEAGADLALGDRWTLEPRLRIETWAGDRDPSLRVGVGARHTTRAGWWGALAVSAGGRDVLHMGPGIALAVGRTDR